MEAPEILSPIVPAAEPPADPGLVLVYGAHGRHRKVPASQIRPYDFRQPAFMGPAELRQLRQHQEEFVQSLAARLAMYLRIEVAGEVSRLLTVSYQAFADSLVAPAHISLFKAEPLKGICLLSIPPRLGLAMVDRLLGGSAVAPIDARDLTDIETALLDQVVQIILNEWCNHWQAFQDLRPATLGTESSGRFLQTAPHDTEMLALAIQLRVGECLETVQMAFPHYTLEPIVRYLETLSLTQSEQPRPQAQPAPCWNADLDDLTVPITAEWTGLQMTARELLALQPGDVLKLDPRITQHIQVHVAGTPKYQGQLGTRGAQWAVELCQNLSL